MLENAPRAVPFALAGAAFEMSDGSIASSRLKPVKKTSSASAMLQSDSMPSASSTCARSGARDRRRGTTLYPVRAARHTRMAGSMSTNPSTTTGR